MARRGSKGRSRSEWGRDLFEAYRVDAGWANWESLPVPVPLTEAELEADRQLRSGGRAAPEPEGP